VIVVADTSVLINLCRVGQGGLLRHLFGEVIIPPEGAAEFARLAAASVRFAGIVLPDGIRLQAATTLLPAFHTTGLDAGESAALALAVEVHAEVILVDERRGYEVARRLGLRTIGILGILLQAKTSGALPAVRPVMDALQRDAGFWLSESLRKQVLSLAGETP